VALPGLVISSIAARLLYSLAHSRRVNSTVGTSSVLLQANCYGILTPYRHPLSSTSISLNCIEPYSNTAAVNTANDKGFIANNDYNIYSQPLQQTCLVMFILSGNASLQPSLGSSSHMGNSSGSTTGSRE
jgi:hypothetical protein